MKPSRLFRLALPVLLLVMVVVGAVPPASAADPNDCDAPGDAPNVIVGDLYQLQRWGNVSGITAFSVGTYSCNVGTCWLDWITGGGSPNHPTIGQNMFRLKDGRFEQLGQSWLKHGFFALSHDLCDTGCLATDGEHLGVNCADPYSSGLNGQQSRLGPKFEVNATRGTHPHPVTMQNRTGDEIFKRLQLKDADLDPGGNAGARYFIEGQYVAADDARAGNQHDNASYREVRVTQNGAEFDLAFVGSTVQTRPGILAWMDVDPSVQVVMVDDPDGGRFYLAAQVTDLGNGTWHYEYAVQNLDSHRSAAWYGVPIPDGAVVTNIGFHDVDYHSGEPQDLTDWGITESTSGLLMWGTLPYATNPDANALRWGTLYNFRFDADRPPGPSLVTLGLFRDGQPGDVGRLATVLVAPTACNGNGACDPGEDCVSCPNECSGAGPDNDGDGEGYCVDCNDNDGRSWTTPGEVANVRASRGAAGEVSLTWSEPLEPGSAPPRYEVVRSGTANDFMAAPACLREADPTLTGLVDGGAPAAGSTLFYLVRARNSCALGLGTTGTSSLLVPRLVADCP